jgi:hypothetical protein
MFRQLDSSAVRLDDHCNRAPVGYDPSAESDKTAVSICTDLANYVFCLQHCPPPPNLALTH